MTDSEIKLTCLVCSKEYIEKIKKRISADKRICITCRSTKTNTKCTKPGGCHNYALGVLDGKYCSRDIKFYFLEKYKREDKKPCSYLIPDKPSRCLNYVEDTSYSRCLICRQHYKGNRNSDRNQVSEKAQAIVTDGKSYKLCGHCKTQRVVNSFITFRGKLSLKCNVCREKAQVIDRRRKEKNRENGFYENKDLKLKEYKRSSKKRGLQWELSDDQALKMIISPCHYCDCNDYINGIDRVDNNRGYLPDNTVACCYFCNRMKGVLDYNKFLLICSHISCYKLSSKYGKLNISLFGFSSNCSFANYRNTCLKKKKERINTLNDYTWDLSVDQFNKVIEKSCNYCGISPFPQKKYGGIDRIDNTKGYTLTNVVSCCSICNRMKSDIPLDKFLQKIKKITNTRFNPNYERKKLLDRIDIMAISGNTFEDPDLINNQSKILDLVKEYENISIGELSGKLGITYKKVRIFLGFE